MSLLVSLPLSRVFAVALVLACLVVIRSDQSSAQTDRYDVLWVWSGALTTSSAIVKAKVRGQPRDLHLLYGTDADLQPARRLPVDTPAKRTGSGVATFTLTELAADARYYYAVADGDRRTPVGEFRTPVEGPMSFQFAAASCAGGNIVSTVSNHPIFTTLETRRPLFFIHMGDFHYINIRENNTDLFRRAYDRVLGQYRQAHFYRLTPIVYMWDDHDFGPNDADGTSRSREAAREAYVENVPHYPLSLEGDAVTTIQQAFSVGRVRFIVSDMRSARDPVRKPDGPGKSLLGLQQREWLSQAFERAAADRSALVIWVGTVPWITRVGARDDGWEPYAWERRWLADRLRSLGLVHRLVMISGDAHMVAIDDGRNSNYATDAAKGERAFPILQAAPLDRSPSVKGGPYSHGVSDRNHQFGWVDVRDDGTTLRVTLTGHDRGGGQIRGMRLQLTCRESACAVDP
jgi:phosphodiesterase/alkaline phosphatase D-like protein